MATELAPGPPRTVPQVEGEARRDSRIRSGRCAGGLAVTSIPASVRRPSGSRAARKAGAFGASAPSVLCRSDSRGARTPSSRLRVERIRTPSAVTLEGFCSEGLLVPAGDYTELDTRRRYTLYARREGMRGRSRWFTPSRPARELKTAQIGKGHGGSTQPIRC
jgi:hypothetical protein